MFYEVAVQQNIRILKNLSAILAKSAAYADSKKFEMDVLLKAYLAPDQFNLTRQVQIACDMAKATAARLAGREIPAHEDNEKTVGELQARIAKVVSYLETFTAKDFVGAAERRITQPRWEGKTLSGTEFLTQWSIPNVYFHVTTAYAILRHNGVEVGKKDYLGEINYRSN